MKRTVLGILAVVLFTSAFSVFCPKYLGAKKEYNLTTQSNILNFTEEKQLNEIISRGLRILQIKDVKIVIVSLTEKEMEEDPELMGFIHDQESYYLIKLRPGLYEDYYLEILAHELIHLQQLYKKELKLLYYGFWYKGVVYPWSSSYWDRIFEQEAFEKEETLKLLIISNPPLSN